MYGSRADTKMGDRKTQGLVARILPAEELGGGSCEMNDEVDETQVEAAAEAIWKWTKRWYHPTWENLGVGRRGLYRLMAWAALSAAYRARTELGHPSRLSSGKDGRPITN